MNMLYSLINVLFNVVIVLLLLCCIIALLGVLLVAFLTGLNFIIEGIKELRDKE